MFLLAGENWYKASYQQRMVRIRAFRSTRFSSFLVKEPSNCDTRYDDNDGDDDDERYLCTTETWWTKLEKKTSSQRAFNTIGVIFRPSISLGTGFRTCVYNGTAVANIYSRARLLGNKFSRDVMAAMLDLGWFHKLLFSLLYVEAMSDSTKSEQIDLCNHSMLDPENKAFLISFSCLYHQHGRCVCVL